MQPLTADIAHDVRHIDMVATSQFHCLLSPNLCATSDRGIISIYTYIYTGLILEVFHLTRKLVSGDLIFSFLMKVLSETK